MNLIPCPDCKNQISPRSLACPHCGCPRQYYEEVMVLSDDVRKRILLNAPEKVKQQEQSLPATNDELINLSQACKIMGVSYSKGQKLAKAHTLPFRKLGASWVISRSALYTSLGIESLIIKG